MRKLLKLISLTVIFYFISGGMPQTFAHTPYVVKERIISDPNGNPLIVETSYGDGVFTADPSRLQIRNTSGNVIATSKSKTHTFSFCPSVNSCWVFPYRETSIFATGYKLNVTEIDFSKTGDINLPDKEKKAFFQYINSDKITVYHGAPEDPENEKSFLPNTFTEVPLSILVSPFAIILNHITPLSIIAILTFLIVKSGKLFRSYPNEKTTPRKSVHYMVKTLVFILLTGLSLTYFLSLFLMSFSLSIPFAYLILFSWLSVFLEKRMKKRTKQ